MEEDYKRGKEYYQVNLDMGRLFWIAFLIGVILISVFIFGFFIGGDREGARKGLDLSRLGKTDLLRREGADVEKTRDELKILDLFDKDLEAETRYIDVQSLEEAAKESEITSEVPLKEPEPAVPLHEVKLVEKPVPSYMPKAAATTTPPKEKSVYRPVGDYYIQVASFVQEANATRLAEKLRKNLYRVEIEKAVVNEKTFYRVQVGPFEQRSVAVNTMTSMKRIFDLQDPYVVKKQS